MECHNKELNLNDCNCSYPCSRKGLCCECIRSHRRRGELPACYFPADAEKTYNRPISYFVELYNKGKI
jgi:hypothetical protein